MGCFYYSWDDLVQKQDSAAGRIYRKSHLICFSRKPCSIRKNNLVWLLLCVFLNKQHLWFTFIKLSWFLWKTQFDKYLFVKYCQSTYLLCVLFAEKWRFMFNRIFAWVKGFISKTLYGSYCFHLNVSHIIDFFLVKWCF